MIEKIEKFWSEWWHESFIILGGMICANLIFISRAFRQSATVDPQAAGELGSFVGGYVGSMFALFGVVLLFRTLKKQASASRLQSFENRYFELIKLHRDNVAEMELKELHGRKVFVWLLREFRCLLEIVQAVAKDCGEALSAPQLMQVAYYCLFYGVGPNSSRMLKISLQDFDSKFVDAVEQRLNSNSTKLKFQSERGFPYIPFEGHQSRLGHYYRHLYQMIQYVHAQPPELEIVKYEYVKTIRAQLSTHEQAMLLMNSLTPLGRNWWKNGLVKTYRLVQNIPRDFFVQSEIDMSKLFEPGYFEWEE
jgi:hypothetical protein